VILLRPSVAAFSFTQKQSFERARLHALRKSQLEKYEMSVAGLSCLIPKQEAQSHQGFGLSHEPGADSLPVFNRDENRYTQK
jgi:hypothetical protein